MPATLTPDHPPAAPPAVAPHVWEAATRGVDLDDAASVRRRLWVIEGGIRYRQAQIAELTAQADALRRLLP